MISIVLYELREKVLHEVHNTDGGYLVAGKLDQIVSHLILLGVHITSLHVDLLLLRDR